MTNQTKKTAVLCIALVVGCGLAGLKARSADSDPEEATTTKTDNSPSFLDDPNLASSTEISLGDKELLAKTATAVGLVAALGVATFYLSKKVLPKVTRGAGKEIHILETAYLGPRKSLHLVEVGNQKLLVGSTNEQITTLAHVDDAWLDLSKQNIDETVKA